MILNYKRSELINCDGMIGSSPAGDIGKLISDDCDIYIDGRLVCSYRALPDSVIQLAAILSKKSKLTKGKRTNGLSVKNAIYGFMPRNPTRCNYCRPAAASISDRKMHSVAVNYARSISKIYSNANGAQFFEDHKNLTGEVGENWLLGDTMWSTLNVNVNHAIKYHRDTGNYRGAFSNVAIYREGCTGGNLALPELGVTLKQKSGACIFFHGGEIIHGVTEIKPTRPDFIRSSIVLYTMREMKNCGSMEEERAAHNSRTDEIALEKRMGNPKLRARYAKKIAEAEKNG